MNHLPVLPIPTPEKVRELIDQFEKRDEMLERALRELVAKFPSHTDKSQVLLKVVTINALYATQILNVYVAVERIVECNITERLKAGDASVVNQIAEMQFGSKIRHNYSFATKYCSWHQPDLYPIFDSRVEFCLRAYEANQPFAAFTRDSLWDYETFRNVVQAFRERYGLRAFNFKQLDEFLFELGSPYFAEKVAPLDDTFTEDGSRVR